MNAFSPTDGRADLAAWRADFPILAERVRGKPFVYLDSAASAQKPNQVIDAMTAAMRSQYANVHRGLHWMSERTTDVFEESRRLVAELIHAPSTDEIVFTRNSTEAINLVAQSYGRTFLKPGDAVVISAMEHHANIVPWQMLRDAHGIELRIAAIDVRGELDMTHLAALLSDGRVRLVAITHMSNVLGTVTPATRIASLAHEAGAVVLFDGSQSVVHRAIDVQAIGADFYVFTGHKLYGPTGIGVLWGRRALLDAMPPVMGGGDMIATVSFERSTWAAIPNKFEAGTPAIVEAIGLGAAIRYVQSIGYPALETHEASLVDHAMARLSAVDGLEIIGRAQDRGGVVSFTLEGGHPHDVATLLDLDGIAVRAGNHCAEPLMGVLGLAGTARASFGLYTTHADIDALADGLGRVRRRLG